MVNQEERDLELALSLQEQEVEERRAWVMALAGGQYHSLAGGQQALAGGHTPTGHTSY